MSSMENYAETLFVTMVNFFIDFFGLIINGLAIILVYRDPHFMNSYGTLSMNHLILNMANFLMYFLWVTPVTYTQSFDISTSPFGKILGQFYLFFWITMLYSHLSLTLNRVISLLFPSKSRSIFSYHSSIFIIFTTWIIGFLHIIPMFWYENCYIIYNPSTWILQMAPTKCGSTFSLFIFQYFFIFLSGLNFLLNLSTWILIFGEKSKKHPVESRLLKEELWKTFAFFMASCTSNIGAVWVGERWQKYLMTCVIWQAYHLFDGLIVIILHFHRKLFVEQPPRDPQHIPMSPFIHVDNHNPQHSFPHVTFPQYGQHSHSPVHHFPNHISKVDTF